eukprot:3994260-Pleurochrysis_carterae.AAC.3
MRRVVNDLGAPLGLSRQAHLYEAAACRVRARQVARAAQQHLDRVVRRRAAVAVFVFQGGAISDSASVTALRHGGRSRLCERFVAQ